MSSKDIEFGEPIETREGTYFDGFTQGIYRARNIIDEKDKEIARLNNIIEELEKWAKSIQLTVYRSDDMPVYQHQDVLDKLKELKEGDKE